jgi:hypothetical protein
MEKYMEIKATVGELRERSLMIGAPLYGGQCHGQFMKSMIEFMVIATAYGLNVKPYFIYNESLITRARNYIADEFMRSDCSRLLFIDSDIGFKAEHIIHMLAIQTDESEYDVLCGPYPKKTIAWEKIKMAVDKGFADKDPTELENYVGDYVFNPIFKAGEKSMNLSLDKPVEVLESGTGFMMIKRTAFEKFKDKFPEYSYKPDHARTENFDGSREIHMYFQAEIDPKSKRYLSEDYWWCQRLREAGGKIWLCPWIELQHAGSYNFAGSLSALASIGAAATASANVAKNKNK